MTGFPILFLDVDGPLLPFGDGVAGEPGLARLAPLHGPWLAALPCELVCGRRPPGTTTTPCCTR